jgi:hypothetical protein
MSKAYKTIGLLDHMGSRWILHIKEETCLRRNIRSINDIEKA